jgi:cell division protein FtsZ
MLVTPGIINVDFADVRAVMSDAGSAIVGIGVSTGQDRAVQAMTKALTSPLLEVSADGAQGILLGVSGGRDMRMAEINEAAQIISKTVDPDARIIFGAYHDRKLKPNQIKVTVIATGFRGNQPGASSLFDTPNYPAPRTFRGEYEQRSGPISGGNREFSADIPPVSSGSTSRPFGNVDDDVADGLNADTEKDSGSSRDGWDIPAFLRKKKK